MIPNTVPGVTVRFRHRDGQGHQWSAEYPVVAWDSDGEPMIAKGRLLAPASVHGADWVLDSPDPNAVVQVAPAPGWFVRYAFDGKEFRKPLVGWGVHADGHVEPLTADGDGIISTDVGEGTICVDHDEWVECEGLSDEAREYFQRMEANEQRRRQRQAEELI